MIMSTEQNMAVINEKNLLLQAYMMIQIKNILKAIYLVVESSGTLFNCSI